MFRLFPSPASFHFTTRLSPLLAALALMKCGLTAIADCAVRTRIASVAKRSVTRRACLWLRSMDFLLSSDSARSLPEGPVVPLSVTSLSELDTGDPDGLRYSTYALWIRSIRSHDGEADGQKIARLTAPSGKLPGQ